MEDYVIQMSAAESTSFLSPWYDWGIEVIRVIQRSANPALTAIIELITVMGTGYFYIPLILIIFWWIDEKRGLRLGILFIISAWINSFLKDLLQHPRPFHLEPSVGLAFEPTYGAPSGHAQFSFTFWVPTAVWISQVWNRKKSGLTEPVKQVIVWTATFFFILLIGYTRLYLGVHFPTDLFTGWFLAAVIVIIWFIAGPFLTKRLVSAGIRAQNISAAAVALLMSGLYAEDRTMPALFLGFCLGYTLMKQRFPFSSRGEINGKRPGVPVFLLRALVGFAGMAIIYLVLRFLFPGEGSLFAGLPLWGETSPLYEIGRFIRYGLVGFWASAGAPYVFHRMGLASFAIKEGQSSPE